MTSDSLIEIPSPAAAIFDKGLAAHQAGAFAEAEPLYQQALEIDPNHKQALSNLGAVLARRGELAPAIVCYQRALAVDPGFGECWFNLANALRRGGEFGQAEGAFLEALRLLPSLEGAAFGLGQCQNELGKFPQAAYVFNQIVKHNPNQADAWLHLGVSQKHQGQGSLALESFATAARLRPTDDRAQHHLGLAMMDNGRMEEALKVVEGALALKPDNPTIHNTLGIIYQSLDREDQGLRHNLEAVRLNSQFAEAWNNLGNLLGLMGQPSQAVSAFRKALELRPNAPHFHSNLLLYLHYDPTITPEATHGEHCNWAKAHLPPGSDPVEFFNTRDPQRRLKVGLVSPDFRDHTVASFLAPFIDSLDRKSIEVFAYSAVHRPDETTKLFQQRVDHFRDIAGVSDEAAAEIICNDQIDILVDFAGHSAGNRLTLFSRQCAPITMTQFGYPNTTGVPGIGFRITDAKADPVGMTDDLHTEKLIRVDDFAWVWQPPQTVPAVPFKRIDPNAILFGSFNNLAKVNDRVLAVWARILAKTPGSKLWILTGKSETTAARIAHSLESVNVDPTRVERFSRMDKQAYFAAQASVDIALDTFPYNGDITSLDALWMGTPVLAMAGRTYVSRQGLAINKTLGLEDWIARNEEDYIAKAVALSKDAELLAQLRGTLRNRLAKSPICDVKGYGRRWEKAVRVLWAEWCDANIFDPFIGYTGPS